MEEERGGTGHPKLVLTLAEARLDLDTGFSALGWHIEGNDKKKKTSCRNVAILAYGIPAEGQRTVPGWC